MNVSPIKINEYTFSGQETKRVQREYTKKDKAIVAGTSAFGVASSLAVLAKTKGYSLAPRKMFSNFKKSYFAQAKFTAVPVIAMGIGTCLGGLLGGHIIDKDEETRKLKRREAIMQIGNISIPILLVDRCADLGAFLGSKAGKVAASITKGVFSIAGLFAGVYTANYLMNKVGNYMFHNKNDRGVKATDFSAHVDDMILAASYVDNNDYVHKIGRIVPLALVVPGYEVGIKNK